MAGKKDKNSIERNTEKYKEYFKEDLDAISEELSKSKEYSKIIDEQLDLLMKNPMNRGVQHYVGESLANAVSLQTQRESLRKDRFAIKKAILDYSLKFADDNEISGTDDIMSKLDQILKMDALQAKREEDMIPSESENEDLDSAIDAALDDEGKENNGENQ